jgi:hypothetical protein
MAVADVYRFVINGRIQEEPTTTILHWRETTAATGSAYEVAAALNTALLSAWKLQFLPLLSEDFRLMNGICNRIHPTFGPTSTQFLQPTDIGGVDEDSVPELAALVISLVTNLASESGRGRCYLAGIPQTHTDAGILVASARIALASATSNFFVEVNAAGGTFTPGVWSRKNEVFTDLELARVNSALGTQRRRRPRNVGPAPVESP